MTSSIDYLILYNKFDTKFRYGVLISLKSSIGYTKRELNNVTVITAMFCPILKPCLTYFKRE